MFHAEFLIDDRDVVKLLRDLATLRTFNIVVRPTSNAKKGKNGVEEEIPGGGMIIDRLTPVIRDSHPAGSQITTKAIAEMIRSLGNVPSSNLISTLVKAKVIKKTKARGVFVVSKAA